MKYIPIFSSRSLTFFSGFIALLFLAACNLSSGGAVSPTAIPATPSNYPIPTNTLLNTLVDSAFIANALTPKTGTSMVWADGSTIVYVPEGKFVMGSTEKEPSDHSPAHNVDLSGFWIQQTEVTNAMFSRCVEAGVCTDPAKEKGFPYWYENANDANYPVVGVDWNQASTYCGWMEGTLPTEAQWEKTARGTDSFHYPWGTDKPACTLLDYKDCLKPNQPAAVHSYPAGDSPYLAADMAGNVFEWVKDRYSDTYYSVSPASNPAGPDGGETRVLRGSSFLSKPENLDIFLRNSLKPTQHRVDIGFRCVLSGKAVEQPPAQSCTTSSYVSPNLTFPTPQPWSMTAESQCWIEPDGVTMTSIVKLTEQSNWGLVAFQNDNFSSSAGVITVTGSESYADYTVFGPGVPIDQQFTLEACYPWEHLTSPGPQYGNCPSGYYMDSQTLICHHIQTGNTPDSCGTGSHWRDGVGCVFFPGGYNPVCPVGYVETYVGGTEYECWPAGNHTPDCLEGSYDQVMGCCEVAGDILPSCFWGYTLDPQTNMCLPDFPKDCKSFDLFIPSCSPTPPPTVKSCDQLNQTQCSARLDCKWNFTSSGPGRCSKK